MAYVFQLGSASRRPFCSEFTSGLIHQWGIFIFQSLFSDATNGRPRLQNKKLWGRYISKFYIQIMCSFYRKNSEPSSWGKPNELATFWQMLLLQVESVLSHASLLENCILTTPSCFLQSLQNYLVRIPSNWTHLGQHFTFTEFYNSVNCWSHVIIIIFLSLHPAVIYTLGSQKLVLTKCWVWKLKDDWRWIF